MGRRHYLVTYDIADDKRRDGIFQALRDQGDHTQFSVFLCQLDARELAELKTVLIPLTNQAEDQILIVDLGKVHWATDLEIEAIGKAFAPPVRTMIV